VFGSFVILVYDADVSRLSDRVVAITGASAGIGRACALHLAREGAAVIVSARREDRLAELTATIAAAGGRALAVPGDVTQVEDMRRLVTRAVDAFGRLDVMICNAGIGYHGTLDDTPTEVMRRMVDVNVLGTFFAAQAALGAFRRQGGGHLIAISSISGRRGVGGSSVYSATKAAQIGLIEGLRAEFVGSPFMASIVYPVATETEFREAIARDFGQRTAGHGPRQSADAVARAVVDCVRSPRPEVYPLRRAKLLAVLAVLAPGAADRLTKRYGRRVLPPASTT